MGGTVRVAYPHLAGKHDPDPHLDEKLDRIRMKLKIHQL
jgi:hypothetical protein